MASVLVSTMANNSEDGPRTAVDTPIDGEEPSVTAKDRVDEPDHEVDIGPAIYPPVLESMKVLGYIKDKNGIEYSRDVGRSASIHDEVYFIFGETFCTASTEKSVGTTSNTIAYVEDRANFLESNYREISDGGKVKAFVPLNDKEIRFEEENRDARVVFRMSGGTVDIGAVGIVWFQVFTKYEDGEEDYHGIGQARLSIYSDGRILVERLQPLLFGPHEPRIGSFSVLFYQGHVYLWSHRPDKQIILARVDMYKTALRDRYEYWSGSRWDPRWHDAVPTLHDVQHGAIVHTNLFGKDKSFVFVGVNRCADSVVQISAAAEVQGPFDLTAVCKATTTDCDEGHRKCIHPHIYPHLWASNVPKRELIVTWSESPPGGVTAARLKFKVDEIGAIKDAEERRHAAEEQEAHRLASIVERRKYGYESDESGDIKEAWDRRRARLKRHHVVKLAQSSSDPP